MRISRVKVLRKVVLPLLRQTSFDFKMRHPYVPGARLRLNSFMHKGYWYYGKRREQQTMVLFAKLIKEGDHVVEVGGHIGFISIYFKHLAGRRGTVTVFEPGSNNLPYIRRNIDSTKSLGASVNLVEKAVGDYVGQISFFEDPLTGQNNSAVPNFVGYVRNSAAAFVTPATSERLVPITTIDEEIGESAVSFIKIDVEGFEKSVLFGAAKVIEQHKPVMMVEVQADELVLFDFFTAKGWVMLLPSGSRVVTAEQLQGNVFVLHKAAHKEILYDVFSQTEDL